MSAATPQRFNDENRLPTGILPVPSFLTTTPRKPLVPIDVKSNQHPSIASAEADAARKKSNVAQEVTPSRPNLYKVVSSTRHLPPLNEIESRVGAFALPSLDRTRPHTQIHNHHASYISPSPAHVGTLAPMTSTVHSPLGQSPLMLRYAQSHTVRPIAFPSSPPSMPSEPPGSDDISRMEFPFGRNDFPFDLWGVVPPAEFEGPLPRDYIEKKPVEHFIRRPDGSTSIKKSPYSMNPWDYIAPIEEMGPDGKPLRRRFTPQEFEVLELFWGQTHTPHKWHRQKIARWFGTTTRHIAVWFQNRRQELKKHEDTIQREGVNSSVTAKAAAGLRRLIKSESPQKPSQKLVIINAIVSDYILPADWFSMRSRRSQCTPSPVQSASVYAPPPPPHTSTNVLPQKRDRRFYSLDDVCDDREQSMSHRPMMRSRPSTEFLQQLDRRDPLYHDTLVNMLSSELSSEPVEVPEDVESEMEVEDSPTHKRIRTNSVRPMLPPMGLGGPPYGRASSNDILLCSSRLRNLRNNGLPIGSDDGNLLPPLRTVASLLQNDNGPKAGEFPLKTEDSSERKLARQGSWSQAPTLTARCSFSRSRPDNLAKSILSAEEIEDDLTEVPGQTRSPTPTEISNSPATDDGNGSVGTSSTGVLASQRLPIPEGRSIYSMSTDLEPETKRGEEELDEGVLTGAQALIELFHGSRY